ncbi:MULTISPECIES: pyruvate dehydrogenase (acetyl-transferring) E1 component subunit alpha [unclassified Mycoplasma]|uniref:pyruvate dehydrogenase (acetyl-transferring) E1 component subunit alpha n=1 Tax=unclassified Mycoplasma TaxID=2683645 RepID=UPI00211CC944|nr:MULTISPECIES: pyruvate dehydrogenase (acetyl-transferring) E1 component subunit alpha [unclassified Mycoplasma]UUM19576.1 pyruvate dehydrogenase (acetyl-transferring) E1 component subunit alpha [Mycoplasma sp. 1578d]UUM24495.1 pyruvate dehydrogenase (acetyl-transferring) E1 component subunit alpha [Mycoplasma sp. 3686d]
MSHKYKYALDKDGKYTVMSDPNEMIRILDINGDLIDKKYKSPLSNDQLLEAYKWMVLSRQQDTYMLQLQRQGRMLTFAPNFGEEALQVATAYAMDRKKDWLVPAFRSNATMLALGVPMINQLLYWNGNEWGCYMPEGVNVVPINIVIGAQISHAAGIAYGMKHNKTGGVAVTFIGNGGTTEGEFSEGINFAAVQEWPAVFCINNNQWAISTPNHFESVSSTLSVKAAAYGCAGIRVDGNDFLASYEAIKDAIEYARTESKPIVVEFVTWRQGPHTTSDNPRVYRTETEEKEHEKWEPMHRFEKYLTDLGIFNEELKTKIWAESLDFVKKTYEESLTKINTKLEDIFDYTYEKLPEYLQEQKQEAIDYWSKKGAN